MIYNAQYYPTSSSCFPITIVLTQKQIILNAFTPKNFQKKINFDNCFGLTYSKDDLRTKGTLKNVSDYIPFLLKAPSQTEIDNLKENDNITYTTITIHSLDIPDNNRLNSNNDYKNIQLVSKMQKMQMNSIII